MKLISAKGSNYNCPSALNAQIQLLSWPFNSYYQTKDLHKSQTNIAAE